MWFLFSFSFALTKVVSLLDLQFCYETIAFSPKRVICGCPITMLPKIGFFDFQKNILHLHTKYSNAFLHMLCLKLWLFILALHVESNHRLLPALRSIDPYVYIAKYTIPYKWNRIQKHSYFRPFVSKRTLSSDSDRETARNPALLSLWKKNLCGLSGLNPIFRTALLEFNSNREGFQCRRRC